MRYQRLWCHVALLGSLAVGCGQPASEPPPAAAAKTPTPQPPVETVAAPANLEKTAAAPAASAKPAPSSPPAKPEAATAGSASSGSAGKPGNRTANRAGALNAVSAAATDALKTMNPFKPPKFDAPRPKPVETTEESKAVRLVGFVDTGKMKALLAFDGALQTLSEGDVYNNVSIVAVTPPTVTLKHGQRQWEATLFQQPIINTTGSGSTSANNAPQVTIGSTGETTRPAVNFDRLFPAGNFRANPLADPGATDTNAPAGPSSPNPTGPSALPFVPGLRGAAPQPIAPPRPPVIPATNPTTPPQ